MNDAPTIEPCWEGEEEPPTKIGPAAVVFSRDHALANQLAVEMARAWQQGDRLYTEDFLDRHPSLADNPDAVIRLISEEICLRQDAGQEVATEELEQRFPRWTKEVRALQSQHRWVPADSALAIPADFRVLAQLGQGAQGRVYLATQPVLADRPVVLKITPCKGREHLSLARLQHTHIVPLYWVQDDPARDTRTLCMPYYGSVTLAGLLKALAGKPPGDHGGQRILDILDRARLAAPVVLPAAGPARSLLGRLTLVKSICWMGACLADALQHAHERGLVHLDLKPSNVLVAFDGQPMLLDFHLARGLIRPEGPPPRGMGGTPWYMSPEQAEALEAVFARRPVPRLVDGRSDIYSLGMVLYEMLGGPVPLRTPLPRLEKINPHVAPGLADLVHKCLATDPAARYPDAATLAADLRRHLADLPLRGVLNRSWPERWAKWRKRKPHALAFRALVSVLVAGLVTAGASALAHNRQELRAAEKTLEKVDEAFEKQHWSRAVEILESGLKQADILFGDELHSRIAAKLDFARMKHQAAQRGQELELLHGSVNQILFLTSNEEITLPVLQDLEGKCRLLWKKGLQLWQDSPGPETAIRQGRFHTDMLDLATIRTGLINRQGASAEQQRDAGRFLDEAEALFGASPILCHERRRLADALGDKELAQKAEEQAKEIPPRTAWEHRILGRSLLYENRFEDALTHLDKALDQQPRDFWSHFHRGICFFRLQQFAEAIQAFKDCILLSEQSPETAHCYFNLALAQASLGQTDRAATNYTHALRLDPRLCEASLNRGILRLKANDYPAALADLKNALDLGSEPAATHFNIAQVYAAQNNRAAAARHLRATLLANPAHDEARAHLRRLETAN